MSRIFLLIKSGKEKAPPSLARRRWYFYIPFSVKISAIGAAKHSALAYVTNHHERGGQEQSGSRDLHPSPFTF
jgi:hypothetical protein